MKITRYSKDVDILMVKVSDEHIAYAEEAERFIVHFSADSKPVLLEILEAKDFIMESLDVLLKAAMTEGVMYMHDAKRVGTTTDEDNMCAERDAGVGAVVADS